MKIAGMQKVSLIDYSPYVSTVLFTVGCPFRCGYCHNPDLVEHDPSMTLLDEQDIFRHLEEKKAWVDAVVVTGGEPTIHKDLPEFIAKVKKKGFLVKLDTNGTNPEMLKRILEEGNVDYVAMDVKHAFDSYHSVVGVDVQTQKMKESIALLQKGIVDYEFRTTVIPGLVDKKVIQEIGEELKGSKRYVIQGFRNTSDMYDNSYKERVPYTRKKLEEMREAVREQFGCVEIRC